MSSSNIVPVAVIEDIQPHPNADALELATVSGWQTVVGKGRHKVGDIVVYIPADSILPVELSDKLGVTRYLSNGRVKPTRLRGEKSFGIVMKRRYRWSVGKNVADFYGITKYEPPVKQWVGGALSGKQRNAPDISEFPKYTDLENLRYYRDILSADDRVVLTEKIHGTNSRVGLIAGEFGPEFVAGSRRLRRAEPEGFGKALEGTAEGEWLKGDAGMYHVTVDGLVEHLTDFSDVYWSPLQIEAVRNLLTGVYEAYNAKSVVLYGEIFGDKVQPLGYGHSGATGYRAFDLLVDGKYIDYVEFEALTLAYGVSVAPTIYVGPYVYEIVAAASEGTTMIGGVDHIREGVVVKPLREKTHPKVGRCIFKMVSDTYLLSKSHERDVTDA